MIDTQYYEWFERKFTCAVALMWCSATSVDDVLVAFDMRAEQAQPAMLADLPDIRLLAGRVGGGALVVGANSAPADETLAVSARPGPCMSVLWSDFVPPRVTFFAEGKLVASFDPFDWEFVAVPDLAGVERWIAATPVGREVWEDNWGIAVLGTAEALCRAAADDEWVRAVHVGIPLE